MLELGERHRRALVALKENDVLRFADLPIYVGYGTMAELVSMGLAERVNKEAGQYSKKFGWRLARESSRVNH